MPGVVSAAQLEAALKVPRERIEAGIEVLRERIARTGAGVRLQEVGDGWQLRTDPRLAQWVAAVRGGKPFRLSRAALETLAVVAFRQPVSKGVIDDIRGVDCGGILRSLLDRGLIRMTGRADEPGRPMTYGTTPTFLEVFGLRSLADLPTLKDLRQLADDDPDESPVPVVPFPGGPKEPE
jgi:segregation and condensation protein B